MIEQQVDVPTPDGPVSTFLCHPEEGGPFPVILFFMDAPGIREELRDMARRLATSGYYVVLPNLYHRAGEMELGAFVGEAGVAVREKMMALMGALTIPMVMRDTDALLEFLSDQPAASHGPMGCVGYCMSGQFAINAAARHPQRIAAAASVYGVKLVTDQADSPHMMAAKAEAELYFACAETDHWAPPEMVEQLSQALAGQPVDARVEVYPGVEHGFAFPQRPAYDKPAAERHWERLLALFRRRLG